MKSSEEEYFEVFLQPYACYEGFLYFFTHHVEPCVEEISTPYPLESQNSRVDAFDLTRFFSEDEQLFDQIIIRTSKDPSEILSLLKEFAKSLSTSLGDEVGFGFGSRVCKNQDWIEHYKRAINPVIAGRFYIRPSWHKKSSEDNLFDIVVDPALAFGSGHHATTSMCLKFLSGINLSQKRVLDLGCGSGILSLACKMLGATIEICDTDPLAIEESHKNFALNDCLLDASWVGSLNQAHGKYDVIVANIVAHVIFAFHDDFREKLEDGGLLILSGILVEDKDRILAKFSDFELLALEEKDGWVAIKLLKFK